MKALRTVAGLIVLFIQLPIWWYLIYKILQMVNATELMWFLFYVYVPVTLFTSFIQRMLESEKK
jgi:hypothetical protein